MVNVEWESIKIYRFNMENGPKSIEVYKGERER